MAQMYKIFITYQYNSHIFHHFTHKKRQIQRLDTVWIRLLDIVIFSDIIFLSGGKYQLR
jgi:predicted acetyltransferase